VSQLRVEFDDGLFSEEDLQIGLKKLSQENVTIRNELKKKYESKFASLYLPQDTELLNPLLEEIQRVQKENIKALVLVGIGGSNLGTLAIVQALFGLLSNEINALKVYFADTVDTDYIQQIKQCVEQELKQDNQVHVVVVTKSGATTETVANFEVFLDVLMCYRPKNYYEYITVITDENSPLAEIAQQRKFSTLYIPKLVGGRFSVLSAVGLFPLGILGVNIHDLIRGAHTIVDEIINEVEFTATAKSAAIKYWYWQNNIRINNFFLFSVSLEGFGKWYRQLVAESLGKEHDREGKSVRVGITPTVSIGSTDLHSVGQLYLGGPRNFFTTFVTIEQNKNTIEIPKLNEFEECVKHIQGASLSSIMNAIVAGVKKAYQKEKLPFCSISVPELSPFYLGQLLQYAMLETMYLGTLLNINAFDQPHVELYKKETRKILADE
jgi:glucose-6-phosphate isomerase